MTVVHISKFTNLERPLDRRITVEIVQWPLDRSTAVMQVCMTVGLKHGRWKASMTVMLTQGCIRVSTSRYTDARIDINTTAD